MKIALDESHPVVAIADDQTVQVYINNPGTLKSSISRLFEIHQRENQETRECALPEIKRLAEIVSSPLRL